MKCLGQETFFYSTRRMLISVLWTARGKEEHKILAPRVCLQTAAAAAVYGKRRHFGKPGYAAVYKFEVSESVKSYFRQAVIFRKKALRMKGGRPFLPLQDHSLQGTKTQYIYIPLHPLKTPNKLLAGFPAETFYGKANTYFLMLKNRETVA